MYETQKGSGVAPPEKGNRTPKLAASLLTLSTLPQLAEEAPASPQQEIFSNKTTSIQLSIESDTQRAIKIFEHLKYHGWNDISLPDQSILYRIYGDQDIRQAYFYHCKISALDALEEIKLSGLPVLSDKQIHAIERAQEMGFVDEERITAAKEYFLESQQLKQDPSIRIKLIKDMQDIGFDDETVAVIATLVRERWGEHLDTLHRNYDKWIHGKYGAKHYFERYPKELHADRFKVRLHSLFAKETASYTYAAPLFQPIVGNDELSKLARDYYGPEQKIIVYPDSVDHLFVIPESIANDLEAFVLKQELYGTEVFGNLTLHAAHEMDGKTVLFLKENEEGCLIATTIKDPEPASEEDQIITLFIRIFRNLAKTYDGNWKEYIADLRQKEQEGKDSNAELKKSLPEAAYLKFTKDAERAGFSKLWQLFDAHSFSYFADTLVDLLEEEDLLKEWLVPLAYEELNHDARERGFEDLYEFLRTDAYDYLSYSGLGWEGVSPISMGRDFINLIRIHTHPLGYSVYTNEDLSKNQRRRSLCGNPSGEITNMEGGDRFQKAKKGATRTSDMNLRAIATAFSMRKEELPYPGAPPAMIMLVFYGITKAHGDHHVLKLQLRPSTKL